MDQSEHRTRWPWGQRLRSRIGRKYIRVLTHLTSVGNDACTFDIVTRPENWRTANLRHVSATCAQYGVGPTSVGMLLGRATCTQSLAGSRRHAVIAAWRLLGRHVRVVTAPFGWRVGRPGEGGGRERERERGRRITTTSKQQREARAVGRGAQALPDPTWHAIEAATKEMVEK